ncbi:phist protein, partial [Plasmodium malariae]
MELCNTQTSVLLRKSCATSKKKKGNTYLANSIEGSEEKFNKSYGRIYTLSCFTNTLFLILLFLLLQNEHAHEDNVISEIHWNTLCTRKLGEANCSSSQRPNSMYRNDGYSPDGYSPYDNTNKELVYGEVSNTNNLTNLIQNEEGGN